MRFERSGRGLLQPHAAAASMRVDGAAYTGTLNRAAAGMRVDFTVYRVELDASGARLDMDFIANMGRRDGSRPGLELHWAVDTLHTLAAGSCVRAQAGLAGHYQLVANGDVAAQPFVGRHADADAVAGLRNRRIRLDFMNASCVAVEEIVLRTDDAVDAHAGGIAGTHFDAAGAGLDVQIDGAVDGEGAVERTFALGCGRLQDQSGKGQGCKGMAKSHRSSCERR